MNDFVLKTKRGRLRKYCPTDLEAQGEGQKPEDNTSGNGQNRAGGTANKAGGTGIRPKEW